MGKRAAAGLAALMVGGLFAGAAPAILQAQSASSIAGVVTDGTNAALAGTALTLSSPNLIGGVRRTVTNEAGVYRFPALVAGVYDMTAERAGFKITARRGIRIPTGATVSVDLELEVASVAETVTVTRPSPVIDVKAAAASTDLDSDLLQNLPASRQQPETINLVPGVAANVAFGGTQSSNALSIDGVGVSETKLGSSFLNLLFNYNWIEDVHVVAAGAAAEYGEFTGLAADSIVRSGSNRFAGLGEVWTIQPGWIASNTSSLDNEVRKQFTWMETVTQWDSSAQLGGPLATDRLWFFTGFQYMRREDNPAEASGIVDREHDPKVIAKLTTALSPAIRLEGFYERDWSHIDGAVIGSPGPPETLATQESPAASWNLRLTWVPSDRTLIELRHSGYRIRDSLEPMPPNSRHGPASHLDLVTDRTSGNAPFYLESVGRPLTAAFALTRYVDGAFGRQHEFKVGGEYQRTSAVDAFGYPGGRSYLDYDGDPFLVFLYEGSDDHTTSRRATVYAQDSWRVSDRVTLHPGLRFSINRGAVPDRGTVFSTDPLSPRLGIAWDVTRDHKTVVRAHYGRYHDALLSGQFQFMDGRGEQNPFIVALVQPSGEFTELDRFDASKNVAIDNHISHSYVDQYVIGVERELAAGMALQAQYLHRDFRHFMAFVDTGSIYEEVMARDPGPDGRIGTPDDGGIFAAFNKTNPGHGFRLLTNPRGAFRRYSAFQITGRKRFTRGWQVLASYVWSRTEGNIDQRLGSNAALNDAGDSGVFADPNQAINAVGRTSFDFPQEVKIEGTYRLPWAGLTLSGVYASHSGLAWGRRANIQGLWQGSETIRIEPRGTRRLPFVHDLDLRIERTIRLVAGSTNLGLFADLFNATNQGVPDSASPLAVVDVSGASFGQPGAWRNARSVRLGARVLF